MKLILKIRTILQILLLLFVASVSYAQIKNTKSNSDAKLPMKITANQVEFDDQKGTAIYIGNVIATQGSRELKAEHLVIQRAADQKISLVIATGKPAYFKAQPNPTKPVGNGTANIIKYFPLQDKVDLIGNATLEQNGDTIHGELLSYFFEKSLLIAEPIPEHRTTVILQPKAQQ